MSAILPRPRCVKQISVFNEILTQTQISLAAAIRTDVYFIKTI